MWPLCRSGLCTEVVFKRWSLIKGFTLRFICIKFWQFLFSIFRFQFPFPLFTCSSRFCFRLAIKDCSWFLYKLITCYIVNHYNQFYLEHSLHAGMLTGDGCVFVWCGRSTTGHILPLVHVHAYSKKNIQQYNLPQNLPWTQDVSVTV